MNNNSPLRFKGLGVAVVTPFLPDGNVDYDSLKRLVEGLVAGGVDYLLALGTTSESPTLTPAERQSVLGCIAEANDRRLPILLGIGGNCTRDVISQFGQFDMQDYDAILSVAPFYNKPSQEGLFLHYKALAENAPKPVVLYNVPGRTSCNIEAQTVIRIADSCPNVVGIKEASGRMAQILYLLRHKPDRFAVISGDDLITLPLMAAGTDGLISVTANAFPHETAQMVHCAQNGRFDKALEYHNTLFDITQCCFKEGNPAGIKAVLAAQGKIHNRLRLPLAPVSEALARQIKNITDNWPDSTGNRDSKSSIS